MSQSISNPLAIVVFLIILYLIIYYYQNYYYSDLIYIQSNIDHNYYYVRNLPDNLEAANMLAIIRQMLEKLQNLLVQLYPNDKRILLLKKRFQPNQIQESIGTSNHTSYTVNKGDKIIFCLRNRGGGNEELIDKNTLFFVALHEYAHIMTITSDHTEEYWENFRFILAHAVIFELYKYENYGMKPLAYCGTNITDNPLDLQMIPKYIQAKDIGKYISVEAKLRYFNK